MIFCCNQVPGGPGFGHPRRTEKRNLGRRKLRQRASASTPAHSVGWNGRPWLPTHFPLCPVRHWRILEVWRSSRSPVVEVEPFPSRADLVWSEEERLEFISFIAHNPEAGDVIVGSGGIRKVRWTGRVWANEEALG